MDVYGMCQMFIVLLIPFSVGAEVDLGSINCTATGSDCPANDTCRYGCVIVWGNKPVTITDSFSERSTYFGNCFYALKGTFVTVPTMRGGSILCPERTVRRWLNTKGERNHRH
ncbi:hypothetical protein NPIL_368441 [Nephila pilipes]|uniref:Uncharacterized protein n=1 Tax=Nephila pilipes TaxID=299642 RepID=A0A8X6MVA0_NEPPI|nr:hypothetical protein NPIL_368441 [Nephila pilipes]